MVVTPQGIPRLFVLVWMVIFLRFLFGTLGTLGGQVVGTYLSRETRRPLVLVRVRGAH